VSALVSPILFLALGAAVGAAQAGLLLAAVRRRPNPLSALARLVLVGAALVVAARLGHLGAATLGWVGGLVLSGARCYRRLR
jgi:formate-dependent nitrite reductase membrane component NrfD